MAEFDKACYEKLVDGLEISEIKLSDLERTSRIDAEFYQKKNLLVNQVLDKWDKNAFSKCFNVSDGNHMSISDEFCNEGVPYYRGQDIYNLFIENSSPLYISNAAYNKSTMRRSYLRKGDVLMSIVGAIIGNSALVTSDREATCSCKLAILRSCDESIMPETMLIFIKTKYGQNQIQKFKRGAAQTGLLLEDFEQLYIPKFTNNFQKIIKNIMLEIEKEIRNSKKCYNEAQEMLERELGYTDYIEPREVYSIKLYSEVFESAERMDSEYYQRKYDDYDTMIMNYGAYTTVGAEFNIIKEKCDYSKKLYNYTEIGDINISNGKFNYSLILTSDLPANAKIIVRMGDIVISKVRPYRGAVSIIDKQIENHLVSSAFTVLREKGGYSKEMLFVLFRTAFYRNWLLKYNVGTSYPTIKDENILAMKIPVFSEVIQKKILSYVQESNNKIETANILLNKAIRMTEIAIEQGEGAALKNMNWEGSCFE